MMVSGYEESPDRVVKDTFDIQVKNIVTLRNTSAKDRISKLRKLRSQIIRSIDDLLVALYNDMGKPRQEALLTEVYPILNEINHVIENLGKWLRNKKAKSQLALFGFKSYVRTESKGTALIISPWNYPFQLAMSPIISAISAGCPTIIKPSEFAMHTAVLIKEIMNAILPEAEVFVALGDKNFAHRG